MPVAVEFESVFPGLLGFDLCEDKLLKFGGVRGNKVTVDITLANNGSVPWVDAA